MSLDVRLRVFLAVATAGSISRAAELMGLSQPAVSRTINLLEQELGRSLLRRHGRGVTLTDAGEALKTSVEPAYQRVDEGVARLRLERNAVSGRLRIASVHTLNTYLIPSLVSRVSGRYPDVHLTLLARSSEEVADLVERGLAQIGLLYDTMVVAGAVEKHYLHKEEMIVVHHPSLALDATGGRDEVTVSPELPLVVFPKGYALRQMLERTWGDQLNRLVEVETVELMLEIVRTGLAACVLPGELPETMIEDTGLRRRRIAGASLTRRVVAIVAPNESSNPVVTTVLELLASLSQQGRRQA